MTTTEFPRRSYINKPLLLEPMDILRGPSTKFSVDGKKYIREQDKDFINFFGPKGSELTGWKLHISASTEVAQNALAALAMEYNVPIFKMASDIDKFLDSDRKYAGKTAVFYHAAQDADGHEINWPGFIRDAESLVRQWGDAGPPVVHNARIPGSSAVSYRNDHGPNGEDYMSKNELEAFIRKLNIPPASAHNMNSEKNPFEHIMLDHQGDVVLLTHAELLQRRSQECYGEYMPEPPDGIPSVKGLAAPSGSVEEQRIRDRGIVQNGRPASHKGRPVSVDNILAFSLASIRETFRNADACKGLFKNPSPAGEIINLEAPLGELMHLQRHFSLLGIDSAICPGSGAKNEKILQLAEKDYDTLGDQKPKEIMGAGRDAAPSLTPAQQRAAHNWNVVGKILSRVKRSSGLLKGTPEEGKVLKIIDTQHNLENLQMGLDALRIESDQKIVVSADDAVYMLVIPPESVTVIRRHIPRDLLRNLPDTQASRRQSR